jgi:GNAT superfamily N-acetyltransferase
MVMDGAGSTVGGGIGWRIRAGRDADATALIALIWSCWSGYPGIRMDVDREMPELRALAAYYARAGGALWVAETDGAVSGMIAAAPREGTEWEICRVYVQPALHGSGLAHALLDRAERHAVAAGATRLALWSDTRFDRAHRFYEKRSFVRHGPVRVLNDISNSLEFGYAKPVDGVEVLDIAAATSAAGRLAGILIACADRGDHMPFLPPVAPGKALAFWRRAALDVGADQRVIVAAWQNRVLLGVGTLDLGTPENQRHRAEVQNVLVDPGARRRGLGRQILQTLASAAAIHGRSLLTLHTSTGGAAATLFRTAGWREAGHIPRFTQEADGSQHEAAFFWKQIAD